MISFCRNYLIEQIKSVMGAETKVCTSMKDLVAYADSHVGAVLISSDTNTRNGNRINKKTTDGNSFATKLFDREVKFNVVLGEYSLEKLEEYFENLLVKIEKTIKMPSGYGVVIEIGEADWVDKDDSILRSNISVQFMVIFTGGIYKEPRFRQINNFEIAEEIENVGQ